MPFGGPSCFLRDLPPVSLILCFRRYKEQNNKYEKIPKILTYFSYASTMFTIRRRFSVKMQLLCLTQFLNSISRIKFMSSRNNIINNYTMLHCKRRVLPRKRNERVLLRRSGLLNKVSLRFHQQTVLYSVITSLPGTERVYFNSFCSCGHFRLIFRWWKYKYAAYSCEINVVFYGENRALVLVKTHLLADVSR